MVETVPLTQAILRQANDRLLAALLQRVEVQEELAIAERFLAITDRFQKLLADAGDNRHAPPFTATPDRLHASHGGTTLTLLDEQKRTVLIAMPTPPYQLFEVPSEKDGTSAT